MKEQLRQIMIDIANDKVNKFEGLTQLIKFKHQNNEEGKEAFKELDNEKGFRETFDSVVDLLAPYILGDDYREYHKYLLENNQEGFLRDVLKRHDNIYDADDYINKLRNDS